MKAHKDIFSTLFQGNGGEGRDTILSAKSQERLVKEDNLSTFKAVGVPHVDSVFPVKFNDDTKVFLTIKNEENSFATKFQDEIQYCQNPSLTQLNSKLL